VSSDTGAVTTWPFATAGEFALTLQTKLAEVVTEVGTVDSVIEMLIALEHATAA
jgi:hypothetical protein